MLSWYDVFYYLKLFLRWWFVFVAAIALAVSTAWYVIRQQPDTYTSAMSLAVGRNFEVTTPDQAQVGLSNVLAGFYNALAKREVILGQVVEELGLEEQLPWWVIRDRMLATRVDREANLLEIRITDTDPERAAIIANAIGDALIRFTPTSQEHIEAQQNEISRQTQQVERDLQQIEMNLTELKERLGTLTSSIDLANVGSQITVQEGLRDQLRREYATLVGLGNQALANTLAVFEKAEPSLYALPKKTTMTMALAGGGALVLALGAILLLDMLDERWRTGRELQTRTRIKSLAEVPDTPPLVAAPSNLVLKREQAISDAYANIVLAAGSRLPRSLLVSSPQPTAARSALVLDLALMYTRTGHRVIIVDGESGDNYLRDQLELATTQLGENRWHPTSVGQPTSNNGQSGFWDHLKPTAMNNVLLLAGRDAGYERLTSLVPLAYWPEMVAHLQKVADIVIFDGPAALSGPEAGVLAPLLDGTLLVLDGRCDPRLKARKARQFLGNALNERFLGALVIRQAHGMLAHPQRLLAKRPRLSLGMDRSGITITVNKVDTHTAELEQQRLLSSSPEATAPEAVQTAQTAQTAQQAAASAPAMERSVGEATMSWEDLLKLEHETPAVQSVQDGDQREPTGPPDFWEQVGNPLRRSDGTPRRTRIANSTRPSRIRLARARREGV
ncbi:MAG: hypothetical protein EI684_00535 [Candidatus Viridilinea halotolerans]|uniref:Lipopolysaccharide biosynthesis protein n=1 Tax=Candidatus Viridilinea halotolerans TaxID=2491704 RepID=A0A426UBU4_9CHLR|nr:MAG: hypothetical protein EI684_00535 [Candidatus Viridilinea halotolerans]